jgi:nuclear transport factor 2 (NTF2) superfamily protein
VSADFLASDACYEEQMQQGLERQRKGAVQVLPILVRPVALTHAPFASLPMVPTNGKPVTQWSNQEAAWTHITEGIRCVLEGKPLPIIEEGKPEATYRIDNQQVVQGQVTGEHNEIHQQYYAPASPPAVPAPTLMAPPGKPVWMVPYARNPFFTGREEVLAHLHKQFQQQQAQAVSQPQAMNGLGGIGKTQIAVEYAYRYREEYQQVLWASAETVEGLTTASTQIASRLDLPVQGAQEQEKMVEAVKQWLQEHPDTALSLFWLAFAAQQ